jgi:citrate synthase
MTVPRGLYGVSVAETQIAKSDASGALQYRGYDINELFAKSNFEETSYLVLEGRLPTRSELNNYVLQIRSLNHVPPQVYEIIKTLPRDASIMSVLRVIVSALGTFEQEMSPREQKYSLISKMPLLVANSYRIINGFPPLEPKPNLSQAGNLLYLLTEKMPTEYETWVLERLLILYMEHDLNASSFTVRVVASTLADPYAAVSAGLSSLSGPLHGGANEKAMELLLEVKNPEIVDSYLKGILQRGGKVMGFGHRVYKRFDPRARLCKGILKELLEKEGKPETLYVLCDAVEKWMWNEKKLPPNLDFYAAPIFYTLSIPIQAYTPIFSASRIVGWLAHYDEQVADNKLFRPDATYTGAKSRSYVPLEKR